MNDKKFDYKVTIEDIFSSSQIKDLKKYDAIDLVEELISNNKKNSIVNLPDLKIAIKDYNIKGAVIDSLITSETQLEDSYDLLYIYIYDNGNFSLYDLDKIIESTKQKYNTENIIYGIGDSPKKSFIVFFNY